MSTRNSERMEMRHLPEASEVLAKPSATDRKYPSVTLKAMLILKIRSFARGSSISG